MAEHIQSEAVKLEAASVRPDVTGGGDAISAASEMFQRQLEQMNQWKMQLTEQMDAMRSEGMKLMERQKLLVMEQKRLADEHGELTTARQELGLLNNELKGEAERLAQRAGDLEEAQRRLAETEGRRERAERELAGRQSALAKREESDRANETRLRDEIAKLEAQRKELAEAQRQAGLERETLAAQEGVLAAKAAALEERGQDIDGRARALGEAETKLKAAQEHLRAREAELGAREATFAERIRAMDDLLAARTAELEKAERQAAEERRALEKQRQEFQQRIEAFENDQAEQLEALGKQAKRLAERRWAVESAESDMTKALEAQVAQATGELRAELARAKEGQGRVAELEQKVSHAEEAARALRERENQFQRDLADAQGQLAKVKQELQEAAGSLERVAAERSGLAEQLAQQIEAGKAEAAKWERALEEARSQSTAHAPEHSEQQYEQLRKEFKKLRTKAEELQKAKDDLEFQIELRKEEGPKQLETLREELGREIAARDAEIGRLKEQAAAGATEASGDAQAWTAQVQALELERGELQKTLGELKERCAALEAQKTAGESGAPVLRGDGGGALGQRGRLLQKARALRGFRQQVMETRTALDTVRKEIAQQREQIKTRKENLEQVKRLLEKQEMVMARKMADHNAIRTVAAVGIFVIMVLGSVFCGVYRFVHPLYRSEAVVQLAPPADLQGTDLQNWLNAQVLFMRSKELTDGAWKVLRAPEVRYAMHDVREEWVQGLPEHLATSLDAGSKTLAVRYTGPDAEGVSQVCNALTKAYADPTVRELNQDTHVIGAGAHVAATATPPMHPVEDNRLNIALAGAAATLLVSLLLVMIFRHFISRQLKEIDQMADAKELDEIEGDLPEATAETA